MIGSVRISSLLSFVVCIAATVLLIVINKRNQVRVAETQYVDMFKDELVAEADFEEEIAEIDYDADYNDDEIKEENNDGEDN